eukprot:2788327-Amphidinium_carterae.1
MRVQKTWQKQTVSAPDESSLSLKLCGPKHSHENLAKATEEKRLDFLLRSVAKHLSKVDISDAHALGCALDDKSIGGKIVWYCAQNWIQETDEGLAKNLVAAVNSMCEDDAKTLLDSHEAVNDGYVQDLLKVIREIRSTEEFVKAYNYARLYSAVPIPALTSENYDLILANVSSKASVKADRGQELDLERRRTSQSGVLAGPSVYNPDTQQFEAREHWAVGTEAWMSLSAGKRASAESVDFTINEVPVYAQDHYAVTAQSRGAMCDESGKVELESIQALKSAPCMWGKTGHDIRKAVRNRR